MTDLDDIFSDPKAKLVFGAPGRAAVLHHPDGRLTLAVESPDGQIAEATFGPDTKPGLVGAIEAVPSP